VPIRSDTILAFPRLANLVLIQVGHGQAALRQLGTHKEDGLRSSVSCHGARRDLGHHPVHNICDLRPISCLELLHDASDVHFDRAPHMLRS